MEMDGQTAVNMSILNWMELDGKIGIGSAVAALRITPRILSLIAEIDGSRALGVR